MGVSKYLLACVVLCSVAQAAPKLRLVATTVGPVSIAVGANGPAQTVEAFNAGDGALALTVTSSASWTVASTGAARPCAQRTGNCLPLNFALQTSSLARGMHTAVVSVNDSNAIDAPQSITVTVQIGGAVPDRVEFFVAPNGASDSARFVTNSSVSGNVATQVGGPWLSMTFEGAGSFSFTRPYVISARHLSGMAEGTYNGTIAVTGSSFAGDNKMVAVSLRVTSQPIALSSNDRLRVRIARGAPRLSRFLVISNRGLGTLSVGAASATMTSGADWLTAEKLANLDIVQANFRASDLAPGTYAGSIAVASNAVNGTLTIPVEMEVVAAGAPLITFGGVVSNNTFESNGGLGQGAIASLFGEQLLMSDAQSSGVPLSTSVGGTRVLVNNRPAPIYFASYDQINFQLPYDTAPGEALIRVEREGSLGNTVALAVTTRAPRLMRLGLGDYGIIVNQDGTFPIPPTPGIPSRPARRGDALTIYALSLGQTTPEAESGTPVPLGTFFNIVPMPIVSFGGGLIFSGVSQEAFFAGLSPTFVGLYQINVFVPEGAPSGSNINVALRAGDASSNRVQIAIE